MDDLTGITKIIKSALDSFFIKDYDSAISELKSAEVLDRENPEILYNIAVAYCRMEFYNQALDYFKKVLSLKMTYIDSTKVKKLIAYCYINMEKYKPALQFLNHLEGNELKDLQILSMKAYCHEKTGSPDKALSLHRKILFMDKNNLNSINACAFIMAKDAKNLDKALKLAEIACSKDKGNGAFFDTLGYIMLKMGNLDKAEAYLKKAEQIIPFNEEIKEHLKKLYLLKKKS
jgi:tetratricopeptide (TPR) repeat protein